MTVRTGGCLCGAVRYQVEGEPTNTGVCHCRTCQKAASAPSLPFAGFPAAPFTVTKGTPAGNCSSPHVTRPICPRCGSPLTDRSDAELDTVDVMTCSLDDPGALPPSFHVWVSHKPSWDHVPDDLPASVTTRAAGTLAGQL